MYDIDRCFEDGFECGKEVERLELITSRVVLRSVYGGAPSKSWSIPLALTCLLILGSSFLM